MNELLARVRGAFVDPAPTRASRAAVEQPAPTVALLCPPADALGVASAAALALVAGERARVGLVCVWAPGERACGWRAPATRRAQRLAASLAVRRVAAQATGRLIRVALPADPAVAVSAAGRALAATRAPAVLALAGPRGDAIDALLAGVDLILVKRRGDDDVARLACERLAALGPPVELMGADLPPVTRLVATAGLAAPTPRPLRSALEAVA